MSLTMKSMLDAGVHFGHQKERWNPQMKPYVYTARGGIHIIDLQKTLSKAREALDYVKKASAEGHKMIFVGTKKQAAETIQEAANKCGQYYVTKRWLGGTLTNFVTIKQSIDRLRKIDQMREKGELDFFSKKERSSIEKEYEKLNEYLQGIREMKDLPAMIFVVDVTKEHIAVREAKNLGIKVVGLCDTNSNPNLIDFPIPANDDAIRSIKLFSHLIADAYLEGAKNWEEKLRAQTDKQSDLEKEEKAAKKEAAASGDESGPNVVKMNKGRKLVAAGTAEEIEILQEVEQELTSTPEEGSSEGETETPTTES